jgi:hypothetical protein
MKTTPILVLALFLAAVSAIADEPPAPPTFFFMITSQVYTADVGAWAEAMTQTAEAHASHPEGNAWVAYRQLTGGPDQLVRFLFPLYSLGEMDGWTSNRRILIDVLGREVGRDVAEQLELAASTDRIISFNEQLSRLPDGFTPGSAAYFWVARVRVAGDAKTEYAALLRRLQRAHDQQQSTAAWLVYANAVGGESDEIMFFYPFETFAEIDGWPSRKELLTGAYGEREAARLSAALDALGETTTSLWQLEPALSQIGGGS